MASRSLGTLTIDLVAKTAGFEQGMDRAARSADKRMKAIEASARKIGAGIGTALVAGFGIAAAGFGLYIKNTIEAEKVQAQLASRIKDTFGAAGRSLEDLNKQADLLQSKTIFDDEAIGEAQAMLLTFKQIEGVNFDKTIEASLDLATVMGTDAADAAKLLGKALNDPERGLAALSKAGITFTEAERERIKVMAEAGRTAEAQDEILRKLEGTMGSAAEAARGTLGGALQGLKNSFDNLLEGDSGSEGVKGVRDAIEDLSGTLNDPEIKEGISSVAEGLLSIANASIKVIAKLGEAGSAIREYFADSNEQSDASLRNRINDLETEIFQIERQNRNSLPIFRRDTTDQKAEVAELEGILSARNRASMFDGVTSKVDSTAFPTKGKAGGSGTEEAIKRTTKATRELTEAEKAWQDVMEVNALIDEQVQDYRSQQIEDAYALEKARDAAVKQVDDQIADMEFERDLLGMTNRERAQEIELRYASAEATEEQKQKIAELAGSLYDLNEAEQSWDGLERNISDTFFDIATGAESASDALEGFFDNLNAQILSNITDEWAEMIVDFFKNFASNAGGGSGGGWVSTLMSAFGFGGGKASGGWAMPNTLYEVNERGMEMATVRGRDYLLTGSSPVEITPNHRVGFGGGMNVTQVINNPQYTDPRSQSQILQDSAMKLRVASARND